MAKLVYEKTGCSRCGGSGHYSYCQRYGTVCFRCGGSGKQLTRRRAWIALKAIQALREQLYPKVPVEQVQVGAVVVVDGRAYRVVAAETVGEYRNLTFNRNMPGVTAGDLHLAGGCNYSMQVGQAIRLALTDDQVALVRAKAESLKGVHRRHRHVAQGPCVVQHLVRRLRRLGRKARRWATSLPAGQFLALVAAWALAAWLWTWHLLWALVDVVAP